MLAESQKRTVARNLDELYRALVAEVRGELEQSKDQQVVELLGRMPADSGDLSVADMLADLNVGMIDRHVGQLRDIEAARERLASGRFGVCMSCGEDIPYARLLAFPVAKRCVACQTRHEARSRGGRPSL